MPNPTHNRSLDACRTSRRDLAVRLSETPRSVVAELLALEGGGLKDRLAAKIVSRGPGELSLDEFT
ncbi:MAG: hypothetical protein GY953_10070, partial [bacterium]|nr:hypothetical protein [bacterium]